MKTGNRIRLFLVAATLLVPLIATTAGAALFEKRTSVGSTIVLEADAAAAPTVATNQAASPSLLRYRLLSFDGQSRKPSVVWERNLPPYSLSGDGPSGFRMFDIMADTNSLLLCYKLDGTTCVDSTEPQQTSAAGTNSVIQFYRDRYGARAVEAWLSLTNGTPLVRIHLKNGGAMAWERQASLWLRAKQYDVVLPLWARSVDLSNPKLAGGPIRESFLAEDYADANWGVPAGGLQLGVRFKQRAYETTEPIIATIHVKNRGTAAVSYEVSTLSSTNGPVQLLVRDSNNTEAESKTRELAAFVPLQAKALKPGSQNVHGFQLRRQFDLPPGTYTVAARLRMPLQNGESVLTSGAATIQVK